MTNFLRTLLLAAALITGNISVSLAQSVMFYKALTDNNVPAPGFLTKYRLVRQDIPALQAYIRAATAAQKGNGAFTSIIIPLPDGRDAMFSLTPTNVLSDALFAQYPDIKTFKGISADGHLSIRLTTSPLGLMGSVRGENSIFYLEPIDPKSPQTLLIYNTKDVLIPAMGVHCGVSDEADDGYLNAAKNHGATPLFGDANIRTYRFAVAATGEYTAYFGSQAAALAAITNTVNNINATYEVDLAIQFTVATTNSIIYTDANTDPYSTVAFPTSTTLAQNQTAIDGALTTANYDLGMVFNAGWTGGLAQLSSTCVSTTKARGAAGLATPTGPIFDNTVAHEVGHKFAATHSFAANTGSCGSGNVNPTTGWEPGGGSTIMAYAGTCTGLFYQPNGDAYFHGGNLAQMSTFMINSATCATSVANSNAAPVLGTNDGTSFTIPVSTPFRLKGYGSESESDLFTYCWEQLDPIGGTGTASAPASTNTSGPLFRSFPPVSNNVRYFPSLAGLVGINPITYEVLPSVARTLNFRLTTRDNVTPGGRTANQDVTVTTAACATPFAVTSQTSSGSFTANGTNTVALTWNTASSCATCTLVNIRFSRDGGRSFPYVLLYNTANDGAETITVPNLSTDRGRFMVECVNNIFFNVNTANQTITSGCVADGATFTPATGLYVSSAGNAALNQTLSPQYGAAYTNPITGSITTTDLSGILTIFNTSTSACESFNGNTTSYDVRTFIPGATGSYTFNASASTFGLVYNLYDSAFFPNDPCRNFIQSSASYPGTGATTLASTLTATLSRSKVYALVVSSFAPGTPALPATYSITVSGGTLFTNTPTPAGTTYSYVIVNNTTGNIVAIQSTGDMTNTTTFPAGSYNIYGISTTASAATLSAYTGTSFASFRMAIVNQTGGLCASLSSNSRNVGIATPLPVVLASFDGRLTGRRTSMLYWETGLEQNIADYELERSYDGASFQSIAHIAPKNRNGSDYTFSDNQIGESATQVFYRLKVNEAGNTALYSGLVRLKLEAGNTTVNIAPNPIVNGRLEAVIKSANGGEYEISISDITGRVLQSRRYTMMVGSNSFSASINDFASGIYLMRLRGENGVETKKFIKN